MAEHLLCKPKEVVWHRARQQVLGAHEDTPRKDKAAIEPTAAAAATGGSERNATALRPRRSKRVHAIAMDAQGPARRPH